MGYDLLWRLPESGEITRRDVVKYSAIRGLLFFEKISFYEARDSLRNPGRPAANARVEHPPVKNTVDRVLCTRLLG